MPNATGPDVRTPRDDRTAAVRYAGRKRNEIPEPAVTSAKKVLLLELNEVNWMVVDKLIAQHGHDYLPNFARLRSGGSWCTQVADEQPPHLDPWVTWVTLHTGVPREVHGAAVLEQSAESISAKRLWDYVDEAGKSVGVFGSISAYPPHKVDGFMVPGPFAPGDETFPAGLQPIQSINRLGTRMHNRTGKGAGTLGLARMGLALLRLGLRPRTVWEIARQLLRERLDHSSHWRRVCLQPMMNRDFFAHLYNLRAPDFATWHSNHAAHFMHHYWRAWDDSGFTARSNVKEREDFGDAVPSGYRLCDDLIGDFMRLLPDDGVLVVASSMGQQPYSSERYPEGKVIVRFRDVEAFLDVVGREGITEVVPTMVPQWNLRVPDSTARAALRERISAARRTSPDGDEPAISVEENADILTITPLGMAKPPHDVRYLLTNANGAIVESPMQQHFVAEAPTAKQGMHHPDGLLAFFGNGVIAGQKLPTCSNLDVAPTLLTLLGLPVPAIMPGRILDEVWNEQVRDSGLSDPNASPVSGTQSERAVAHARH